MSTETQRVDVLAVLDDEIESLPRMADWAGADASIAIERLTAAREALASLFSRADDAVGLLESTAPTHPRTRKLRAALARVGGCRMSTPKVDILKVGLCQMRVCAAKDCSDAFIEEEVNRRKPSGIASPWSIRRHIEPVYCQCEEDADRHHVIMEC